LKISGKHVAAFAPTGSVGIPAFTSEIHANSRLMLGVMAGTVFVYSLLSHKEFRFIMQLLPLACAMAGNALYAIKKSSSSDSDPSATTSGDAKTPRRAPSSSSRGLNWFHVTLGVSVLLNGIAGIYLSTVHQRGVVDVMLWLRRELQHQQQRHHEMNGISTTLKKVDGILFLMPCHSTPMYSYLHYNVPTRFLSCEPPIM
jgi:phosphatidylinositol glycan class B